MLRPLVRSFVSTVAAACFAFIASTGGGMPICSGQAGIAGHAQHASPEHPAGHHGAPAGSQGCVVHLCCAHLDAPSAAAGRNGVRPIALHPAAGFAPATDLPLARTPHALPFAQGPPAPLV